MSHTLTSNNNKMKITTWANLPESERQAILTQVAEKYALPENAIEKDYWVSMVLRALFNLPYKENLIFKGGTSLSKGWHLIERFSEDKDFAKEVLSDATLYTEIVRHRSVMTSWHGMDYKTHHPSTINFIPPEKVIPVLREDYKKMQDNFIYGDSPSFDELIEKLKELQERFHNQTWSTDFFTDAN